MNRSLPSLAVASAVLFCSTGSARAQLAVVDGSNLVQTTATALSTARTVSNMIQQVNLMRQTLQTINPATFAGLEALLTQGQLDYRMLTYDVNALGLALRDVNTGFDRIFPRDKTAWHSARYSDYDRYYGTWNAEITASAKLAERAQSSVLLVETNNRAVATILAQAAVANGEVRQLQLINQQLALIHARLGDLVGNIATLGRVTASMAASSAGEKLLLREAKLRRRDGYTNRGQAPRILNRLP
jgi:P-type conjugative transfer protein TrbJ